jgi:hypothetical protein
MAEIIGWNPRNGEPIIRLSQENYPGEYKDRVTAWRDRVRKIEAEHLERTKECEAAGHDMRQIEPHVNVCRACGRLERDGEHIGTMVADDPLRLPPLPMIPYAKPGAK